MIVPKNARVLIVGSGGREHALAWKCQQSENVKDVFISAPHISFSKERAWSFSLKGGEKEFHECAQKASEEKIDLVIIGPDNPLAEGIVDIFQSYGLVVFGPSKKAAQLEASKSFAKKTMQSAGVCTPHAFFCNSIEDAQKKLLELSWEKPWVLKADGLALGKGVVICTTLEDAQSSLEKLFQFQGHKVLIEEYISGVEVSWMAICDGRDFLLLDPARDYKRAFDGNKGLNTGGMGAYSPVLEFADHQIREYVRKNIFQKTLEELHKNKIPFCGILYAGLMVDFENKNEEGLPTIYVLEFNTRFGDPEAQVLLPRMKDDFYSLAYLSAKGKLSEWKTSDVLFRSEYAVYVVAAAQGYPENPLTGEIIQLPAESYSHFNPHPSVFCAGIKGEAQEYRTSGGRVCGTLGMGSTLLGAREKAYKTMDDIQFQGKHFRRDIAL